MYELIIEGKPVALKRPRFARSGHVYDSQSQDKKELLHKLAIELKNLPCIETPIHIDMEFIFVHPKAKSKKWKRANYFKSTTADIDNNLKYYLDVFNKILWKDDALIVSICAQKRYGEEEMTVLKWEEI